MNGFHEHLFSDPVVTVVNVSGDMVGTAIVQKLLDHDLRKINSVSWSRPHQFETIPTLVEDSQSTLEESIP